LQSSMNIGKIEDLFNAKVSLLVVRRALPEVIGFLVNKRGPEQAERDLRDIGNIIAQRMLMVWSPKTPKPFQIIKDLMRIFLGNKKLKGKIVERAKGQPLKIVIRDYDCPLCPELKKEALEVSVIHYCVAVSGFVESVLNHLIEHKVAPYTKAKCNTVKSVGSGDKFCEHVITLEYEGVF
jgi:predicted hydrocarbon binding protein